MTSHRPRAALECLTQWPLQAFADGATGRSKFLVWCFAPALYAYAVPEPAGLATAHVEPDAAFCHSTPKEFILPYPSVREAPSPDREIGAFITSTYERRRSSGAAIVPRSTGLGNGLPSRRNRARAENGSAA
jgi:hypothetical protein